MAQTPEDGLGAYPETQRLGQLEKEEARLAQTLRSYTDPKRADLISRQLFEWAVELDEIVERIQSDPHIREKYDYDGEGFITKGVGRRGLHMCLDGLHLLTSLQDSTIKSWFSDKDPAEGEVYLLQHVQDMVVDVAKSQLKKLEETGDIRLEIPE